MERKTIQESTGINTPRAGRREWIGLAVIALPCMLYSMDLTVLNLAVPQLSAALKPSSSQLLWIMDIYGFLIAGFLITMGTLGDRIGRRRLLLIGAAAFGCASVLAAFSNSAGMLIAARALLGIAGATLAPSTLSLIRNMFLDPKQRTLAIGVWIASFSAGGAIGPLIGGVVLTHFWWGAVFLLAVPVMVLLLLLGPWLLPEYRDPKAGKPDLLSSLLSLTAILAIIYGIKQIAEYGLTGSSVLAILAGLAVGALFVRRQQKLAYPMIDLRFFRIPVFRASLATNILGFSVAFGSFFFIAQYLQLVLGMEPLQAGLWTAPSGLAFVVGSMLTPVFVSRIRPAYLMAGGFVLAAMGFSILTQVGGSSEPTLLVCGFVTFCLGISPAATLTTDLIIGTVPPERAGAASGISETASEFGGALGIAVLGSVLTAVYRSTMAGTTLSGIAPEAMETARGTLGGATAVAGDLNEPLSTELLGAAHEAFIGGFEFTTAICALVVLGAAIMVITLLKHAGTDPVAEPDLQKPAMCPQDSTPVDESSPSPLPSVPERKRPETKSPGLYVDLL